MHVQLVVFFLAILVALVTSKKNIAATPSRRRRSVVKLLVAVQHNDLQWQDNVWSALSMAVHSEDVHVHLLIQCSSSQPRQILSYVSRDRIRTKFVRQLPSHPIQRTRKLLHSFVMGDETIVVILHDKSRLIERWDEKLAKLVDNQCILSCPTVSDKGRPRFPTLRVRSTGSIARDDSKEFKLHDDPSYQCVFPSVCCCAELIAGTPTVLCNAFDLTTSDTNAFRSIPGRHVVPNVPLLMHDQRLEDSVIDTDEGRTETPLPMAEERAGITPHGPDDERIAKYGSTFSAKLASTS